VRTLHTLNISKHSAAKQPEVKCVSLQRLRSFLLRDLIPSVILFIIICIGTTFAAEKIYQAKISRSHTLSMILDGSCQETPLAQGSLNPEKNRSN
jgi:hypothetical protein